MWDKLVAHLGKFPNAVLTWIDSGQSSVQPGYPFSIRCIPRVDESRKALLLNLPGNLPIQPGPANLLCHYHNDQLWDLKSLQILGRLERAEQGWAFYPERLIPGGGLQGPIEQMRNLFKARADARKYLQKRGLPRPRVRWDEISELKAEIK